MGIDMISELPTNILHHILSFITTKEAGRTSIVSKRWRYLWVSVPTLCFNQEEFPVNFENYVDTVLLIREDESNILKYHLIISDHIDHDVLDRWLQYATKRNVHELDCEFLSTCEFNCHRTVPDCLLMCHSLEKLKLAVPQWKLVLGDSVGLSNLTTMHLKGVITSSNSLSRLVSSCPILEELCLEDCNFKVLKISANELKRLTIARCIFDSFNKIEIHTPKLLSLNYYSGKAQGCILHDMSSLVNASLMLFNLEYSKKYSSKIWSIGETLQGLSNVKSLTFTYLGAKHLSVERHLFGRLPIFHNMKYLRLNLVLSRVHLQSISYMLLHMPNLETLVIHNEVFNSCAMHEEKISCWTSSELFVGMLNDIKQIKLLNFESDEQEWEVINLLKTMGTGTEGSTSLSLTVGGGIGESISLGLTRERGIGESNSLALCTGGSSRASTSHAVAVDPEIEPFANLALSRGRDLELDIQQFANLALSMGWPSDPSAFLSVTGEPSTAVASAMERNSEPSTSPEDGEPSTDLSL